MSVDSVAGQTTALEGVSNSSTTSTGEERVQQKTLGQDDFFKLLTTQLASQDPLEPMEDTAFIAQMANFSQLEMTSNMATSFENFTDSQSFALAQGYIGKKVTLSSGEEGQVTAVERQDDQTLIFLDGSNSNGLSIDTVYKVEDYVSDAAISSSRQVASAATTTAQTAVEDETEVFEGPLEEGETRDGLSEGSSDGSDTPTRPTS